MKRNTLKQIALLNISAIGLYYSGHNLLTATSIESLLDMLNLIVFFSFFFPVFILSLTLLDQLGKYFFKVLAN